MSEGSEPVDLCCGFSKGSSQIGVLLLARCVCSMQECVDVIVLVVSHQCCVNALDSLGHGDQEVSLIRHFKQQLRSHRPIGGSE